MNAVGRTRERVRSYMSELDVEFEVLRDEDLKVVVGTTAVYINVDEVASRSVVSLFAPVLTDIEASASRLCELLALNTELRFGKFSWLPDRRAIHVEYELLGDYLDRDE